MTAHQPDGASRDALDDMVLPPAIVGTMGGFLLVAGTFLPFYGVEGAPFTLSGWEVPRPNFSRVAALLGLAAGLLALLDLLSFFRTPFSRPLAGNRRAQAITVLLFGGLALLLLIGKGTAEGPRFGTDLELRYGIVPAVAGSVLLVTAGVLALMDVKPGVTPSPDARVNGLAVASLVLGLVGALGGFLSILALIFGLVSTSQIEQSQGGQRGRALAVTGTALGIAGIASIVVGLPLLLSRT